MSQNVTAFLSVAKLPTTGNLSHDMLRPCPMLENPEKLRDMVKKSGAKSTDMQSPEDVDNLYGKCKPYADKWTPTADRLWSCSHSCQSCPSAGQK